MKSQDPSLGLWGPLLPASIVSVLRVRCLVELGDLDTAMTHADWGLRTAEAAQSSLGVALGYWMRGWIHLRKGESAPALEAFERDVAICAELHLARHLPFAKAGLSYAYLLAGRVAEALAVGRAVLALNPLFHVESFLALGEACMAAGHLDEALEIGRRLVEATRRMGDGGACAWALRLLGAIASRREPVNDEEAVTRYGEALALAEELGMRPLIAHCHLEIGVLHHRAGRRDPERHHLTMAATMFRAMGMRFWHERAEGGVTEETLSDCCGGRRRPTEHHGLAQPS